MSKIPDTEKTKYNQKDPFRWVDSQWEKFMTEQKVLKAKISELEHHSQIDEDYIISLEEDNNRLQELIEELTELNVPEHDYHRKTADEKSIKKTIKHKYKAKYKDKIKKYKSKYKEVKKQLKDLVKRTPSKFLSKDSDYSKPNWTQEQIAYWDKMIKESIKNTMKANERSDEWRIEQFNRNRAPEDQVSNIQEMSDKVSELFPENDFAKYVYESPDGEKVYRREFGKNGRELISEPPVSRKRAIARVKYLKSEISHRSYHDGWTLKGMEEELKWLEKELKPKSEYVKGSLYKK